MQRLPFESQERAVEMTEGEEENNRNGPRLKWDEEMMMVGIWKGAKIMSEKWLENQGILMEN